MPHKNDGIYSVVNVQRFYYVSVQIRVLRFSCLPFANARVFVPVVKIKIIIHRCNEQKEGFAS